MDVIPLEICGAGKVTRHAATLDTTRTRDFHR